MLSEHGIELMIGSKGLKDLTAEIIDEQYKNLIGGFMEPVKSAIHQKRKGVLVLGLNPAGGEKDAARESDPDSTYLYYIPGYRNTAVSHPKYFKPIYDLLEKICGRGNVKWDWCNAKWTHLNVKLKNIEDSDGAFKEFYTRSQQASYTIYIGDMFYIHQTDSKKLSNCFKKEFNEERRNDYVRKILNAHLKLLRESNIDLAFIYINSAAVSDYICEALDIEECATSYEYDDVPIFFGSMLSGGRMDKYSNVRLVNEIKATMQKKIMNSAAKEEK